MKEANVRGQFLSDCHCAPIVIHDGENYCSRCKQLCELLKVVPGGISECHGAMVVIRGTQRVCSVCNQPCRVKVAA